METGKKTYLDHLDLDRLGLFLFRSPLARNRAFWVDTNTVSTRQTNEWFLSLEHWTVSNGLEDHSFKFSSNTDHMNEIECVLDSQNYAPTL